MVVDAHQACRFAVSQTIARSGDPLTIVAEAGCESGALAAAAGCAPDAILVGLDGPRSLEILRRLVEAQPGIGILAVADADGNETIMDAIRAGASGIVSRSTDPPAVIRALLRIAGGEHAFDGSVALADVVELVRETSNEPPYPSLTGREREVLDRLATGLSAKEIAGRLFVSRRTVESHLANVYRKLGVHGRIQATLAYRRHPAWRRSS